MGLSALSSPCAAAFYHSWLCHSLFLLQDIAYRSDRNFTDQKQSGGLDWEMEVRLVAVLLPSCRSVSPPLSTHYVERIIAFRRMPTPAVLTRARIASCMATGTLFERATVPISSVIAQSIPAPVRALQDFDKRLKKQSRDKTRG